MISLMTLPFPTCLPDNAWLWLVGKYQREIEIQICTSMTTIRTTLCLRVDMHYVIWFSFESINTSLKLSWIKSWVPLTDFRFFTVLYLYIYFLLSLISPRVLWVVCYYPIIQLSEWRFKEVEHLAQLHKTNKDQKCN